MMLRFQPEFATTSPVSQRHPPDCYMSGTQDHQQNSSYLLITGDVPGVRLSAVSFLIEPSQLMPGFLTRNGHHGLQRQSSWFPDPQLASGGARVQMGSDSQVSAFCLPYEELGFAKTKLLSHRSLKLHIRQGHRFKIFTPVLKIQRLGVGGRGTLTLGENHSRK